MYKKARCTCKVVILPFSLPSLSSLLELPRGTLTSNDADSNENVENTIGFISKTTTLHVDHAFVHFFARFRKTTTRFMEYVNKHRRNVISFPELGCGP